MIGKLPETVMLRMTYRSPGKAILQNPDISVAQVFIEGKLMTGGRNRNSFYCKFMSHSDSDIIRF